MYMYMYYSNLVSSYIGTRTRVKCITYHFTQMANDCVKHTVLKINCGFARTAMRELTPKRNGHILIDKQKRETEFQNLFGECTGYVREASYFTDNGNNDSQFNRDCERILDFFRMKWNPNEAKLQYV